MRFIERFNEISRHDVPGFGQHQKTVLSSCTTGCASRSSQSSACRRSASVPRLINAPISASAVYAGGACWSRHRRRSAPGMQFIALTQERQHLIFASMDGTMRRHPSKYSSFRRRPQFEWIRFPFGGAHQHPRRHDPFLRRRHMRRDEVISRSARTAPRHHREGIPGRG